MPLGKPPQPGEDQDDEAGIVFDDDSSITPPEGLPAILLEEKKPIHEEPKDEPKDHDVETSEPSVGYTFNTDKQRQEANRIPIPHTAVTQKAAPQTAIKQRGKQPTSVRKHLEKPEKTNAKLKVNLLPNQALTMIQRVTNIRVADTLRGVLQSKAGRLFVAGTFIGGLGLAAIKSTTVDRAVGVVTTPLSNAATTFNAKAKALAEKIEAEKSQKAPESPELPELPESPKPQSTEIPSGTVIVPKSIDEAVQKGMIRLTKEGKKKPGNGWEWTHEDVSGFAKDDMERFSVTKQ